MFEKALIRGAGVDGAVDIGLVAETLLFYRSTHLLVDMASLPALCVQLGPDGLLSLLRRPEVTASYCPDTPTVLTNTERGLSQHDFGQMFWHGESAKSDAHDQIALSLTRSGELEVPIKTVNQIVDFLKIHRLPQEIGTIANSARADCDDPHFVSMSARTVLETLRPSFAIPKNMHFRVINLGGEFAIDTNLDFDAINRSSNGNAISGAYILAHIVSSRADTYFAADYMSELVTSPANSALIRLKHFDFVRRRIKSEDQHDMFENVVLNDARTVREVLNSKERSITEFFRLLDVGAKFRGWMHAQHPDAQLVREYYDQVNKETWIGRLPGKSLRFVFFTGAGMLADMFAPTGLGTAAGLTLGAADSLLVDKLLRGWRPSQFIEGPLKRFVN
ncbi:hypothetical protein [Bradyrhizobium sp. SSUT77]|uniref:hypothetical protein n=1 Tax=Bradyrhizobium sp. SSUT77 TaxID=3040603 RepID=UPI00244B1701|nr:hypothetical protein [Bradyrhizobium sp. SSUT77]MDH2341529.1 hypothetical protein [Bradyrhizobium sp. SSUT77]